MKKAITLILIYMAMTILSQAETKFTFAIAKTGQAILTADDNYFNRMSRAEIAIRAQSTVADKTANDLKAQYKANVLEWTDQEKAQITQLVEANRIKLAGIKKLLPPEVIFIKVTNQVEGGMPHTRANAIILPRSDEPLTEKLFYHELFHILSRNQKDRQDSLYGIIGFKPCVFVENDEIIAKKLTNPDVPAEGFYLPVEIEEKKAAIMTFLFAAKKTFDPSIKHGFSGHFGFGLLKVNVAKGKCNVETDEAGMAQILNPGLVTDFFAAIGQNTSYIIHPEEVLADNFVFVMLGNKGLPNPEIPENIEKWLKVK